VAKFKRLFEFDEELAEAGFLATICRTPYPKARSCSGGFKRFRCDYKASLPDF
jgi:hypothetical protein